MFVEIPVFKLLAMMDYCNIANDKLDAQYYLDKLLCGCDSEGTSVHLGKRSSDLNSQNMFLSFPLGSVFVSVFGSGFFGFL
jgi:hypothetical protein